MSCKSCARTVLGLFIQSVPRTHVAVPSRSILLSSQTSQFSTSTRRAESVTDAPSAPTRKRKPRSPTGRNAPKDPNSPVTRPSRPTTSLKPSSERTQTSKTATPKSTKPTSKPSQPSPKFKTDPKSKTNPNSPPPEPWRTHRLAIQQKLANSSWNPRKKLSPDTLEMIRHLHTTQPLKFTTAFLATHFKVSPEAIRRILKSKWKPSDEEAEDRMRRWDKRGERIWSNLVEMGVKPPKRWREMGVGRAENGERPKWKGRRGRVPVNDNAGVHVDEGWGGEEEGLIPFVDETGEVVGEKRGGGSLADRIG
ncbi:hypothetical protein M011DRAFT_466155 [Sporormia fimetaria CBS 119925]|uniref:Required for respiratory growth protein 9, mitochondrial n=1 Tax=Sporormia fimetaria CBS 119925 TaxID=1340428 RepID=A0A6A6VEK8_9PLEO|nr:hypothetical protein M011DRAFT_466155 [Sporormia fimetaria CBS 119925]